MFLKEKAAGLDCCEGLRVMPLLKSEMGQRILVLGIVEQQNLGKRKGKLLTSKYLLSDQRNSMELCTTKIRFPLVSVHFPIFLILICDSGARLN